MGTRDEEKKAGEAGMEDRRVREAIRVTRERLTALEGAVKDKG
jgi:hypothetical protein